MDSPWFLAEKHTAEDTLEELKMSLNIDSLTLAPLAT